MNVRILVMSDVHSAERSAIRIINENKDVNVIAFLGDGEKRFRLALDDCGIEVYGNSLPKVYMVCGNCDWDSFEETTLIPTAGGHRIYMSHGHENGVKAAAGIRNLARAAAANGCDIALFGHTHTRFYDEQFGVRLFNPGAVQDGQYGLITIEDDKVRFEHKSL